MGALTKTVDVPATQNIRGSLDLLRILTYNAYFFNFYSKGSCIRVLCEVFYVVLGRTEYIDHIWAMQ